MNLEKSTNVNALDRSAMVTALLQKVWYFNGRYSDPTVLFITGPENGFVSCAQESVFPFWIHEISQRRERTEPTPILSFSW